MIRKLIGILLLFSLLAVKYSPAINDMQIKTLIGLELPADDADENSATEEESKQSESPADELLHQYHVNLSAPALSVKKVIPIDLGSTSAFSASPYLPPEA